MDVRPTGSTALLGSTSTRPQTQKTQCTLTRKIGIVALSCISVLAAATAYFENEYTIAVRIAVGNPMILIGIAAIAAIAAFVIYRYCPKKSKLPLPEDVQNRFKLNRHERFHNSFQRNELPKTPGHSDDTSSESSSPDPQHILVTAFDPNAGEQSQAVAGTADNIASSSSTNSNSGLEARTSAGGQSQAAAGTADNTASSSSTNSNSGLEDKTTSEEKSFTISSVSSSKSRSSRRLFSSVDDDNSSKSGIYPSPHVSPIESSSITN